MLLLKFGNQTRTSVFSVNGKHFGGLKLKSVVHPIPYNLFGPYDATSCICYINQDVYGHMPK